MTTDDLLNTACDECRSRKLKCSGRRPICDRCILDSIDCTYSPRKKMGRPRKRRRDQPDPELDAYTDAHLDMSSVDSSSQDAHAQFEYTPASLVMNNAGHFTTISDATLNFDLLGSLDNSDTTEAFNSLVPTQETPAPIHDPAAETRGVPALPCDKCACLANLYLSFAALQTVQTYEFPQALVPLKSALATASDVLECPICPHDKKSGTINLMQLITLLSVMTEHCNRLATAVNAETLRAAQAGEQKAFLMGDSQPANMHLHTGTVDCPMRFDIELDAHEWQTMALKVVRKYARGPHGGRSLMELTERLEQRQRWWHVDPAKQAVRDDLIAAGIANQRPGQGDFSCLTLIESMRLGILALKL